ncbi:transposase family protein, partial [Shigella flexneri]|nr:transposase family protein [Shigella flexneri]
LNIPPFLMTPQFTPSEVMKTKSIARARIHVERVMVRLKKFKILSHIPKALYTKSTLVFQLCATLVNFQNPVIKEVQHLYPNE